MRPGRRSAVGRLTGLGELLHVAALAELATKRAAPPGGTSRHKPMRALGASQGLFQRHLTSPPTAAHTRSAQ
jgi:hypothetical protein